MAGCGKGRMKKIKILFMVVAIIVITTCILLNVPAKEILAGTEPYCGFQLLTVWLKEKQGGTDQWEQQKKVS